MIEKIWEGPEAEGREKGVNTAFIEARELEWDDIMAIYTSVSADRLYFGANEKDVTSVPDGFFWHLSQDYTVCVETSSQNLLFLLSKVPYNALVILRNILDISDEDMLRIRFKFRTETGLVVLRDKEYTDIRSLKGGLYESDRVVYQKNEE